MFKSVDKIILVYTILVVLAICFCVLNAAIPLRTTCVVALFLAPTIIDMIFKVNIIFGDNVALLASVEIAKVASYQDKLNADMLAHHKHMEKMFDLQSKALVDMTAAAFAKESVVIAPIKDLSSN